MKWKILKSETNKEDIRWWCFWCENENGERYWLDLFADNSYKGFGNITRAGKNNEDKYETLIGREVEVESISPYEPFYFVKNIKLLEK